MKIGKVAHQTTASLSKLAFRPPDAAKLRTSDYVPERSARPDQAVPYTEPVIRLLHLYRKQKPRAHQIHQRTAGQVAQARQCGNFLRKEKAGKQTGRIYPRSQSFISQEEQRNDKEILHAMCPTPFCRQRHAQGRPIHEPGQPLEYPQNMLSLPAAQKGAGY